MDNRRDWIRENDLDIYTIYQRAKESYSRDQIYWARQEVIRRLNDKNLWSQKPTTPKADMDESKL